MDGRISYEILHEVDLWLEINKIWFSSTCALFDSYLVNFVGVSRTYGIILSSRNFCPLQK